MQEIKLWGWSKKSRTMIRFIKNGDIFCFRMSEKEYRFGRIISKITMGHVVEIFDFSSLVPEITKEQVLNAKRGMPPFLLDTYRTFDRKMKEEEYDDWRIIGHHRHYIPQDADSIFFVYGVGPFHKVDIYGADHPISKEEAAQLPRLAVYASQLKKIEKGLLASSFKG